LVQLLMDSDDGVQPVCRVEEALSHRNFRAVGGLKSQQRMDELDAILDTVIDLPHQQSASVMLCNQVFDGDAKCFHHDEQGAAPTTGTRERGTAV